MSYMFRRRAFHALILFTLLLLSASATRAQSAGTKPIYPIEFKPGVKTTLIEGTVSPSKTVGPDMTNEGSERYSLKVRAGQTVKMEISSDNGDIVFSLSTPDYEIVKDAGGVKRWSGKLKFSGGYIITVFTRKDRARFKLRVTLS